jgi:hypothetical protein
MRLSNGWTPLIEEPSLEPSWFPGGSTRGVRRKVMKVLQY